MRCSRNGPTSSSSSPAARGRHTPHKPLTPLIATCRCARARRHSVFFGISRAQAVWRWWEHEVQRVQESQVLRPALAFALKEVPPRFAIKPLVKLVELEGVKLWRKADEQLPVGVRNSRKAFRVVSSPEQYLCRKDKIIVVGGERPHQDDSSMGRTARPVSL